MSTLACRVEPYPLFSGGFPVPRIFQEPFTVPNIFRDPFRRLPRAHELWWRGVIVPSALWPAAVRHKVVEALARALVADLDVLFSSAAEDPA